MGIVNFLGIIDMCFSHPSACTNNSTSTQSNTFYCLLSVIRIISLKFIWIRVCFLALMKYTGYFPKQDQSYIKCKLGVYTSLEAFQILHLCNSMYLRI